MGLSTNAKEAAVSKTEPRKIRWVLAHEPVTLFNRAASHFAEEVKKRSNGQLEVEVLTVPQYAAKYNKGRILRHDQVVKYIQIGNIEMSQTYTTDLGRLNPDLYVLDLPFLFRNHAHATKVLEGEVGNALLAGLAPANVRGLAFTYSGGYRVIPSKKEITSIDQFKGMKIRTSGSPVAKDTFAALGATPIPLDLEDVPQASKEGRIEGAESTYPRFYSMKQNEVSSVLNDTQHSLFLTSIVVNEKFWNSLSPDLQKAVRESAVSAARLERQESIEDAELTKEKCRKEGIKVTTLSEKEQERFKAATKDIYKKYHSKFSKDYISAIQGE
jgi:tripartite ATP-independent transporter DctP family solute receptor